MKPTPYRMAAIGLLVLLFSVNVYRAATQSITHDEALTYELFVAAPWDALFNSYDANHHVLHTILCKVSVGLFGLSALSLRLPSLFGGALFFLAIFRICERLFGEAWYLVLAVALLALNPYMLDFQSAARGYGLAVAFLFWAFWECLQWIEHPNNDHLLRAGFALALSTAANLVLAPPAVGLAVAFLLAMAKQRRSFEPAVAVSKKGKKKEEPNPYPALGQGLLRFGLPFVAGAWVILMYPLSNATGQQFYVGTDSLPAAGESLAKASFPIAPGWLAATIAWVIPPVLLAASALVGWRAVSRWKQATVLEKAALLSGGAMLVAFLSLVAAHLAFDVPYPEGRTGIYWIPLLTFSGLMLAKLLPRAMPLLAVLMAACVVVYAVEFRVDHYADWLYDADAASIMDLIRAHRPNDPGHKTRVDASWQLEPSLNFYQARYSLDWMAEVERKAPRPGADFYVLLASDAAKTEELHLKVLYKGKLSGTILAIPQS